MHSSILFKVSSCASALLLAACASPDGLAPHGHLATPAALHSAQTLASVPRSAAAWPSTGWWNTLGDPQLDRLVAEALKDNPDLDIAQARARAADAQIGAMRAALLPTVNGSAGFSAAHLPGSVLPAPIGGHFGWAKDAYASFKWEPDLWGGKRAAWEAAVGESAAADVDVHAARLAISTGVARAYAQLGYAYRQQQLAEDELQRAQDARKLTAQRFRAGIDNRVNVKRSDTEVAQDQVQLVAAQHAGAAARVALAELLGKGPDRGLAITQPQPLQPARLAVPADLPAELLGRRPDLVAARWRVEAAERNIKVAKTAFLPNLSLSALAGLVATGPETLLSLPSRFYMAGPAISLPIFEGGRLRANLSAKDAAYDLAVATYNKTLIGAVDQVADRALALQSLALQVVAQQRALDAAQSAWSLADERYKSGIGSFLQTLDVRRDLLLAERALAALQAQQVDLSIQLIQALGGGYRAVPAPDTNSASLAVRNKVPHE
jgi:NodT family efflux transporter outer membrane factor (OMF) lipoprotein